MTMELLYLVHRIPYPPNKGDKIRSFNILKRLAKKYCVHLGAFVDAPEDWAYVEEIKRYCQETCIVDLTPARARLRSLRGLLSGEALTFPYYRDHRLATWVADLGRRRDIRRVLAFSSCMAQYAPGKRGNGVRRIIDFVDVDSDKWRQYSGTRAWPWRWVYAREAQRLAVAEVRIAEEFDVAVFVSAAEADLFRAHAPESRTHITHVNNGVDTTFFSRAWPLPNPYPSGTRPLVFTGAMDYWANVDAVTWFANEVFPLIRIRVPETLFYIVGANPAPAVRRLESCPGVIVTGAVDDVRPHLKHAALAVAPLRLARGIQNKVLEAMAMGLPTLVTSAAADGIEDLSIFNELLGNSPQELAERAEKLLLRGDRSTLGDRYRNYVVAHYGWDSSLQRLDELLA